MSAADDPAVPTYTGPHRAPLIRLANAIGGRLRRAGMQAPRLDLASLTGATGLEGASFDEPEDAAFLARFAALLDDANGAGHLHFLGRVGIHFQFARLLRNRLLARRWLAENPGTRALPLRRPLFIVGQPRTGTTLLYMLLAQDPQARAPLAWELDAPVPPSDPEARHLDSRLIEFDRRLRGLHRYVPGLATAHAADANEPEECYPLLESAALSLTFLLYFDIPTYWAKLKATGADEAREAYRHFRDQVAIMQSRVGGRRWLSKSPAHLLFLDTLLETFPDAAVVIPHREPVEAIPSLCSLISLTRSAASDDVDAARIGATALDWFSESSRRAEAARAKIAGPRIMDVTYPALVADPIGTVRAIYDRFGYPYAPEFEQRMRAWLAANPQHKHGVHRYSLEQFGLDRERVVVATDAYRQRYLGASADSSIT